MFSKFLCECVLRLQFTLSSCVPILANTVPSPVMGVEGHCSVVVWKEPNEPNGEIRNYTLYFIPNNGNDLGRMVNTTDNQLFFVIKNKYELPHVMDNESIFVKVCVVCV